ncbi:MAG: hypothetical protein IKE48_02875 [Parasporobacterium sp.]|nr:hypothetical protein [Parasporobacterium sp.]
MNSNQDFFKKRIADLAAQADMQHIYTNTRFLTPEEQSIVLSLKQELPVPVRLIGRNDYPGSSESGDSSIRKIAVFGSAKDFGYEFDNPIRIIHIKPKAEKFAEQLSHRDYLGSLMGLGIERELTGDIVIRGKEAWVFVIDQIVPFLCDELTQVRHTTVFSEEVMGEVPELSPEFQSMNFNVASERIDLLLSCITGSTREAGKKLLREEKVFVNGMTVFSAGFKLHEGDVIVVRGFGKYIYDGVVSTSRKGRCNLTLRKYV